ncbi:flagellar L-ring protein [Striga asiatica]|uniref:Flagellar L-ring protein n=1 Tax=Striga asiatica TaxID=4170 RepID=A0A5A7PGS2_STRAF|nr:flagellar L-ring protein [Striga asiatica]
MGLFLGHSILLVPEPGPKRPVYSVVIRVPRVGKPLKANESGMYQIGCCTTILTVIDREHQSFSIFCIVFLNLLSGPTDDHILTILRIGMNYDLMPAARGLHCEAPYLEKECRHNQQ